MDWSNLLNSGRAGDPKYTEHANRPSYVQDYDRIAFSAPFRRLANKTQVHPLHDHDHIHHRLIHSVETASVGRSLGMSVGHWLESETHIEPGQMHVVSGMVQAACLAHDIGNPPFGHSGEDAIGAWFDAQFDLPTSLFADLDPILRQEFIKFEGNAQGFRILTRLEMYRNDGGMRLANGVLGAFSKYPVTAHVQQVESSKTPYCGLKKFGVFQSEFDLFKHTAEILGLPAEGDTDSRWYRRHPLVFLVEAADDVCYNIVDMEDAFTSGDLSYETVSAMLAPLFTTNYQPAPNSTQAERISEMRARAIGAAIFACVEAFKENYTAIMAGQFSDALVEVSAKASEFKAIKTLANNRLFVSPRKTELEVSGRNTIHNVLTGIAPVYSALQAANWNPDKLSGYNAQLVRALDLDLRDVTDSYSALHSIADFTSGMTDRYAVKISRMLSGI